MSETFTTRFYHNDEAGNTATIEKILLLPYRDAPCKEDGYKLTLSADYNNNMVYFVFVYDTLQQALDNMDMRGTTEWREI